MCLNDMLNVELYSNILKVFDQTSAETLLALGSGVDENILES